MVARRLAVAVLLAALPACAGAQAANTGSAATQADSQSQPEGSSSSVHHKAKAQGTHHTTVAEEDAPSPELRRPKR